MNSEYLTRSQAADYVREKCKRCSKNTLAKLATIGGGPLYQIFGNTALYTRENLDAWIEAKLSRPMGSTTERPKLSADDKAEQHTSRVHEESLRTSDGRISRGLSTRSKKEAE